MYGMHWFGWGWYMMIFWWALLILVLALVVRWFSVSKPPSEREDSALEILKKRYARGEISKEEFAEKKRDLQ